MTISKNSYNSAVVGNGGAVIEKLITLIREALTEESVYVVTKTMKVVAKSHKEAWCKAKCEASNSPNWAWDVKRDSDDLF